MIPALGESGVAPVGSILVVDDDPCNLKLLEAMLTTEGHRVRSAVDGPSALTRARSEVPDLILLDVMIPGMSGLEICRSLKSEPQTRLCQVMLVTALDGVPDKVEGLDLGADDYVTKPIRRDVFLAKVRALLRVRRLLGEIESAREELSERNRELELKKTLAQTLVHDLKNPLSAVLGNLDLLEMRSSPELRPLVQRGKLGAKKMLKMILDLLDVEGLEQNRLDVSLQPLEASRVVGAAVAEAKAAARLRQVGLRFEPAADTRIGADPVLLRRVVDNLLSRAVGRSPVGGTVEARVMRSEGRVEIAVIDQGPEVPGELRERVFEKYAKAELSGAGVAANRGLGLTFCKLAVEAQAGRIRIDETSTRGAAIRVSFQAAAAEPAGVN